MFSQWHLIEDKSEPSEKKKSEREREKYVYITSIDDIKKSKEKNSFFSFLSLPSV